MMQSSFALTMSNVTRYCAQYSNEKEHLKIQAEKHHIPRPHERATLKRKGGRSRSCRHWLQRKLSFWQLQIQYAMVNSSTWWPFRLNVVFTVGVFWRKIAVLQRKSIDWGFTIVFYHRLLADIRGAPVRCQSLGHDEHDRRGLRFCSVRPVHETVWLYQRRECGE